jgi:hypothetical protein
MVSALSCDGFGRQVVPSLWPPGVPERSSVLFSGNFNIFAYNRSGMSSCRVSLEVVAHEHPYLSQCIADFTMVCCSSFAQHRSVQVQLIANSMRPPCVFGHGWCRERSLARGFLAHAIGRGPFMSWAQRIFKCLPCRVCHTQHSNLKRHE